MGNQHSTSHAALKPRKNVHWKSAGRPAVPGKPAIIPILSDEEPNAVTLRWVPAAHDGGAALLGYQVECNRLGSAEWVRTAPPLVLRPELVLTGLEPPHRYQFRVASLNAVGRSDYSQLSDVLTVSSDRVLQDPPTFLQHLEDITALENDKTEFRVIFTGTPPPSIAWFKDDYEIFSSRRTAITTTESTSILLFHQTLSSDEGEIKCTATNRAGHAVSRTRLALEAAPKLRYPRQYEDGLLYEINETVFLKTTIVGKPTPSIEWRHDGLLITGDDRIEITNTAKFSMLKIHAARRNDRGEYQIYAKNSIGEDTAAFLVTITAPPDPPRRVTVTRQVDKSVTLGWEHPEDDGGCRIGNYVVEYYRTGWNVWLKATTSRKTNVTLFDLIEGSEYRFRVKAESPYGMSAPSVESPPVKIPGRAVDMDFLAVESRIINDALTRDDGEERRVSPAPRRKRAGAPSPSPAPAPPRSPDREHGHSASNEFMLVLYPEKEPYEAERRKSFQLKLEEAVSPPPLSLSAPELSPWLEPPALLRHAASSTELLHERAMARFYKALAFKEEQSKHKHTTARHIPKHDQKSKKHSPDPDFKINGAKEDNQDKCNTRHTAQYTETSYNKWQHTSFEEDYTASTVSSEGEYSEEGSTNGDIDRSQYSNEEDTYNIRDKILLQLPLEEQPMIEEDTEIETVKPVPTPDPNFIPKPILKRRGSDTTEIKQTEDNDAVKLNDKTDSVIKPKKDEKMTIFKQLTKMPVQKAFNFPKLLNKKEPVEDKKEKSEIENKITDALKVTKKLEKVEDKISDEGRTVIDYYTNIVKEYGRQNRVATPLYLNTEDLKTVAEKQQLEKKEKSNGEKTLVKRKKVPLIKTALNNAAVTKIPVANCADKHSKIKQKVNYNTPKLEEKGNTEGTEISNTALAPYTKQVILKTTERATIVIPINYKELEEKAKVTVRSAIDYMVDLCLLLMAFWVYLFKDERLAIPFLILIIYRQLQETIFLNIPEWVSSHTPTWFKKKIS